MGVLDSRRYRFFPEVEGGGNDDLAEGLERWANARVEADIARLPVYWAGGAFHKSSLPPHADKQLIQQFEAFAADFDGRINARHNAHAGIWHECMRDSLALALALSPTNAVVLAGAGPIPAVRDMLTSAGLAHRELKADARAIAMALYEPILSRTGVMELLWAGLDLTVLHVVAPDTPLASAAPHGEDDDEVAPILHLAQPRDAAWRWAEVLWWQLGGSSANGGET